MWRFSASVFFFCSCDLGGECRPKADDSTSAINKSQLLASKDHLSDGHEPTLQISKERQRVQRDEKGVSSASASPGKQRSIHAETEFSECPGLRSEEMPQSELILVLAPKQMQAGLIRSSSLILRDGQLVSDLTDHQGESGPWSEPDEARLNPLSMQSNDFLPTFTNQRPPCVAPAKASFNNASKQRYGIDCYPGFC